MARRRPRRRRRNDASTAAAIRALGSAAEVAGSRFVMASGKDIAETRVLEALADFGDDWHDSASIAASAQRKPATVRKALKALVRDGAAEERDGPGAPGYFGRARVVYRATDLGRQAAAFALEAEQARGAEAFDPEAAYRSRYGAALDFDPSEWEEEGPGEGPREPERFELQGPEKMAPGTLRWVIHDGNLDFAPVAYLYAARGWEAAGEDRALPGVEDALVVLGARVAPSHRRLGLATLLYEAALREAERVGTPLASQSDRTTGESRFWAKQRKKGRAELKRYKVRKGDKGRGGGRYLVGLDERYPARLNPPTDYAEGLAAGRREVIDDGWTPELARRYLEAVGQPRSDYDRGHQAAVRELLAPAAARPARAARSRGPAARGPRSKLCRAGRHDFDPVTQACKRAGCPATDTADLFGRRLDHRDDAPSAGPGLFDAFDPWRTQ